MNIIYLPLVSILGDISPSQSSQGLMALSVMLILLCLVITYCCWGTCCKVIQKRRSRNRRSSSQSSFDSSGSCSSDPRLMMMWSPHHHHEMCTRHSEPAAVREQSRNNLIIKPRILRSEIPPPPYEVLFGQEISSAPPTYSSLALNQPNCPVVSLSPETHESAIAPTSFVTVVIEREPDVSGMQEGIQERRLLRSQSVPNSIDSSSQLTKHVTAVLIRTENREA